VYLLASGILVIPDQRLDGGWRCVVLDHTTPPTTLDVTDIEIRTALPVPDPHDPFATVDPSTYLIIWQAQVRQHCSSPLTHRAADLLAEVLASPEHIVDLDSPAVGQLLLAVHLLRPPGLWRLLARLIRSGLLAQVGPTGRGHWGSYRLVISAPTGADRHAEDPRVAEHLAPWPPALDWPATAVDSAAAARTGDDGTPRQPQPTHAVQPAQGTVTG
jgi:hypothetical protein